MLGRLLPMLRQVHLVEVVTKNRYYYTRIMAPGIGMIYARGYGPFAGLVDAYIKSYMGPVNSNSAHNTKYYACSL